MAVLEAGLNDRSGHCFSVNDNLPTISVLIAARPGQAEVKAIAAAQNLDYPTDKLEIIVARGKQPSVQRNAGIKAACGELIYFLDDDSQPPPGNLKQGAPRFADSRVKMVGGPNLCPTTAPPLERVFGLVLSARVAFGPSRARYWPVGATRDTSEKELILCNLMARREAILELGGFNEALYPNEENALMDELQKRGGRLLYDPEFMVHRRPRPTIKAFVRMLMTYGRGRAEQFRLHPTMGSALNFVPPLFCAFLVILALSMLFVPVVAKILLIPLAFYLIAIGVQGLALMRLGGFLRGLAAVPFVILTHVLYGFGFWRGLFTRLNSPGERASIPVELQWVKRL